MNNESSIGCLWVKSSSAKVQQRFYKESVRTILWRMQKALIVDNWDLRGCYMNLKWMISSHQFPISLFSSLRRITVYWSVASKFLQHNRGTGELEGFNKSSNNLIYLRSFFRGNLLWLNYEMQLIFSITDMTRFLVLNFEWSDAPCSLRRVTRMWLAISFGWISCNLSENIYSNFYGILIRVESILIIVTTIILVESFDGDVDTQR